MKNHLQLVKDLTNAINKTQQADCTVDQVDYWVGSDASNTEIKTYIEEVLSKDKCAVTYRDIFDLWYD